MSGDHGNPDELVVAEPVRFWTRSRKVGLGQIVVGIAAALTFGQLAASDKARFTLTDNPTGPALSINGTVGAYLFALLAVAAGVVMVALAREKWFSWLLGIGIVAVVISFLCWQISVAPAGHNFMPVVDIVRGTFIFAVPLIFGALAGVLVRARRRDQRGHRGAADSRARSAARWSARSPAAPGPGSSAASSAGW